MKAETVIEKSNMREKPMLTKASSYTLAMKKFRMPCEECCGGNTKEEKLPSRNRTRRTTDLPGENT